MRCLGWLFLWILSKHTCWGIDEPRLVPHEERKLQCAPDSVDLIDDLDRLYIACVFDIQAFPWVRELFNWTISFLNDRNDGWHDDIFNNTKDWLDDANTTLYGEVANDNCDETDAARAYWNLRSLYAGGPHVVVGSRCSGASVSVARIASLEGIPQISPTSSSAKLSDATAFPLFSRMTAPDDAHGQVGAMVAMMKYFGWNRVSILETDTQYSKDFANEFKRLWLSQNVGGSVAYTTTIVLDDTGSVDERSARQALEGVPTDNPSINSRIVLLPAIDRHAHAILKVAVEIGFQTDTIWIGSDGWVRDLPPDGDFSWLPAVPGYIGLTPFRNRDDYYQDFLRRIQERQAAEGRATWLQLPDYAAEYMVDAIVAATRALFSVPRTSRRDGALVTSHLRSLVFNGVSGSVSLTNKGDRLDPQFTIFNLQQTEDGSYEWVDVGRTGTAVGSTELKQQKGTRGICFARRGCALEEAPSDRYPIPPNAFKISLLVICCFVLPAMAVIFACYRRWYKAKSRQKRKALEDQMNNMAKRMEQQMQGMYEVINDLPFHSASKYQQYVQENSSQGGTDPKANVEAIWYWEETVGYTGSHNASMVLTGTNFVQYSRDVFNRIEHSYQIWREGKGHKEFYVDLTDKIKSTATGQKAANPETGTRYVVNFETMRQRNAKSNYERAVRREEIILPVDRSLVLDFPSLPEDINFLDGDVDGGEKLLPTFKGQIIQISKLHPDKKWMYGNVLYDPLLNEALKQTPQTDATADGLNVLLSNLLHDRPTSGWFPAVVAKAADVHVMRKLVGELGNAGMDALEPPLTWDASGSLRVSLSDSSAEFAEVANFFKASLFGLSSGIQVTGIDRIQNLPLWQSYVVKKQSMKARDDKNPAHLVHNRDPNGIERKWLFHGTTTDISPKIEQQGFNRAFAGRNAVAYGKGVYFARDATYARCTCYSEPDRHGIQRMFMCRVAVGDWCRGNSGQLTPDPKPHNPLELFDSTVDNVHNPSIFVVYHDAQAYPEYIVSFRSK